MMMSDKNLYQNLDTRLKEVLFEMPQFRRKEDLIRMYVAYEFPNEQSYLLPFWEKAIRLVMKKYFGRIKVQAIQIKEAFCLNHFEPAGFNQVLAELINKRIFLPFEQLHTYEAYRDLGLHYPGEVPRQSAFQAITSIFNPLSYFSKKPELPPIATLKIVDMESLKKNIKDAISSFNELFKDKTISSEDEFDQHLIEKLNFSKYDLPIYKELLVNGGILKKEVVEIGRKKYSLFIHNPHNMDTTIEKTAFVLQSTIAYYAKRIEEFEAQANQTHQEAVKACLKKNKDQAKQYLKRQKMLEETVKQYVDKKYICEENLIKIETSSSNKDIVSLLQFVQAAHDELRINPDEMFDISQSMKEANEERKETNMIIEKMANENSTDVEDEYKLLESQIFRDDGLSAETRAQTVNERAPRVAQNDNNPHDEDENSMNLELLI